MLGAGVCYPHLHYYAFYKIQTSRVISLQINVVLLYVVLVLQRVRIIVSLWQCAVYIKRKTQISFLLMLMYPARLFITVKWNFHKIFIHAPQSHFQSNFVCLLFSVCPSQPTRRRSKVRDISRLMNDLSRAVTAFSPSLFTSLCGPGCGEGLAQLSELLCHDFSFYILLHYVFSVHARVGLTEGN